MPLTVEELIDPAVRRFVAAVNAGDRAAFRAALAPGATMADDGSERNLTEWTEKEIFAPRGRMEVESQSEDGRGLVVRFWNEVWGEMRTKWRFLVTDGEITRFETGQA
ncbi:nuclear transport factor 2 family protein [Streptomyces inusitatus]|uniref:nuclear transport factor 2 family protein n=1 Tax=Streptomyces inusitatus TaxID=68221 RepID=UPI001E6061B4|nr:nuclear transport factor 2 family protein [Streptomyces inusitatus]